MGAKVSSSYDAFQERRQRQNQIRRVAREERRRELCRLRRERRLARYASHQQRGSGDRRRANASVVWEDEPWEHIQELQQSLAAMEALFQALVLRDEENMGRGLSTSESTRTTAATTVISSLPVVTVEEHLEKVKGGHPGSDEGVAENGNDNDNDNLCIDHDRECCICYVEFEKTATLLPCGHLFHTNCIGEWLSKHGSTCPVCRFKLPEDSEEGEDGQFGADDSPPDRRADRNRFMENFSIASNVNDSFPNTHNYLVHRR